MRRGSTLRRGLYAAAVSAAVLFGSPSIAAPDNGAPVPAGGLYDAGVPTTAEAPTPGTPAPAPTPTPTPTPTPSVSPAPAVTDPAAPTPDAPTAPPPSPSPAPTTPPTAG